MAHVEHTGQADEESVAFVHENETSKVPQSGVLGWRAMIGGVVSTLAMMAVVAACSRSPAPPNITARSLLDHPLTVDILTENLITIGHHDRSEKKMLHDFVETEAHNHVARLRDEKPDLYNKLGSIEVTKERKYATLRMLKSLGDPRMHEVRHGLMAAIQDTLKESGDHKALTRHLVEKLGPQTEKIRQLSRMYFAHSPRGPVANGAVLQEQDFEHMELVKSFDKIVAQLKSRTQHESTLSRKLSESSFLDDLMQQLEDFFDSSSTGLTTAEYSGSDLGDCISAMMEGNSGTDMTTCFSVLVSTFSGES